MVLGGILPNIGTTELIVIAVVALLLFGKRVPDIARGFGRSINLFKKGLREIDDDVSDVKPQAIGAASGVKQTLQREADEINAELHK